MKRRDKDLVNECIDLYWSFLSLSQTHNEIAKRGPTQESKMMEFHGDFPQLSNIKPEILVSKVDLMAIFEIQPEHREAAKALQLALRQFLPVHRSKVAGAVLLYRRVQKLNNPKTRQLYTHKDCAKELGMSEGCYKVLRDRGLEELLKTYRRVSGV